MGAERDGGWPVSEVPCSGDPLFCQADAPKWLLEWYSEHNIMHIWALFLKSHLFHHLISVTWAETASFSIGIQDVAAPAERCLYLLLPIVTPDHLCLPRPPPSLTSSAWSQRRLCCRGGRSHQAAWSRYSWICALSWRYTPEREMERVMWFRRAK